MNQIRTIVCITFLLGITGRGANAQVQDPIPFDSILCAKYGGFIPNENRVFHSMMLDSLAAVKVSGLQNPTIEELLSWKIMSRPGVLTKLTPNKLAYEEMLSADKGFKSLDQSELTSIYLSNLLVKAKVIAKNNLQREKRFFKTTYLLKIEEIYHTDWGDISIGDTVVLKSPSGCEYTSTANDTLVISTDFGDGKYSKDNVYIFSLSNAEYHKATHGLFKHTGWKIKDYQDYACSGFFRATPGYNQLAKDFHKLDDLKEYIELHIK